MHILLFNQTVYHKIHTFVNFHCEHVDAKANHKTNEPHNRHKTMKRQNLNELHKFVPFKPGYSVVYNWPFRFL